AVGSVLGVALAGWDGEALGLSLDTALGAVDVLGPEPVPPAVEPAGALAAGGAGADGALADGLVVGESAGVPEALVAVDGPRAVEFRRRNITFGVDVQV